MSKLRLNVFANFLGQGWAALLQLVVIPVYIGLIGIEAYGLVGFYLALMTTIQVFDLGLSQTMTREFARLGASPDKLRNGRDLLKTVGLIYWGIAGFVAAAVLLASPFLADHVIKAQTLSQEATRRAIMLMAVIIPMQWAVNLRLGALMGLERQVLANALRIVAATVSTGGAVLVLWLVSATVTAFFWWQLLVSFLSFGAAAVLLGRVLPPAAGKAKFRTSILRQIRGFAAGMSGINIASTILTQLDKWILITLLPLKIFGYYVLAVAVANSLYLFITPIFNGFFPRFSVMSVQGSDDQLRTLYQFAMQLMTVAVIPAASTLSLFSSEVLTLWTRDSTASAISAPLVSILVFGTAINGLMNVPYALQLAYGWTKLIVSIILIEIVIFVPAILIFTPKFGPVAAASAWLFINVVFAVFALPPTHRRLFVGKVRTSVTGRVFFGTGIALAFLGTAKLAFPQEASATAQTLYILISYAGGVVLVGLYGPQTRAWMLRFARGVYLKLM